MLDCLGGILELFNISAQTCPPPTWKRTFGFHPLAAFADHGPDGSGEPLAIMLRPGNAAPTRPQAVSRSPAGPGAVARREALPGADPLGLGRRHP